MKRRLGMVLAVLAIAVAVPSAALAAQPASQFTGTWVSTDTDGSTQVLVVSSGSRPSVVFQDFYASACDTFAGPSTHWVSSGTGVVDGDVLEADFHKSGCGSFSIGAYTGFWAYDGATGTLVDEADITWYRVR